jgi:membrane protein
MIAARLWRLLTQTAENWSAHQASSVEAALAFYCAFSLAPLIVIIAAIVGQIVGTQIAYGYVASQLSVLLGGAAPKLC